MAEALVANWNIEWAPPRSARGTAIRSLLSKMSPDLVCLTETYSGFLESSHIIEASADYGYARSDGRRKVILFSKHPWYNVDRAEHMPFPPGRFIAGTTDTPLGPLKVIGICIPWKDAHVRTGRHDRQPWEEHLAFLRSLKTYLAGETGRLIVLGDFNQRIPRLRQPSEAYGELKRCFATKFQIATKGLTDGGGAHAIDHLAMSHEYRAGPIEILPAISDNGIRLSDHFGFAATLYGD